MDDRINIITAVYYSVISGIESFNATLSGSVRLTVADWVPLNFVKGSAGMTIDKGESKSGVLYATSFSVNLKSQLKNPGPVIIRVEFESGNILIIGERDLPVRLDIAESLTQKNLKFSHKSWHYPYKLIQ